MNNPSDAPSWAKWWNPGRLLWVGDSLYSFRDDEANIRSAHMTLGFFKAAGYPLEELVIQLEND